MREPFVDYYIYFKYVQCIIMIPRHFDWRKVKKQWPERKQNTKKDQKMKGKKVTKRLKIS